MTKPKKIHKLSSFFAVGVLTLLSSFFLSRPALAENVSLTVTTSNKNAGENSDWTITFTAPADMPSGSVIYFYLPADWNSWPAEYFNASNAIVSSNNGSFTVDEWGSLTFTLSTSYTTGQTVTIGLSGIKNISKDGTYTLNGSYSDANWNYFNLQSNSITIGTAAMIGKVVNSSGTGVAEVYVNVWCDNGKYAYTNTDSNGDFTLSGVSGSCTVSFSYWGTDGLQPPAQETITLTSGSTVYRDGSGTGKEAFRMLTPNVSAILQTSDGTPVSNAWGWIYNDEWTYYNWFTTSSSGLISLALSKSDTYYMEIDISGTTFSSTYTAPSKITFTYDATTQTDTLSATINLTTPNVKVTCYKPDGANFCPDYTYLYVYNSSYTVYEYASTLSGVASFYVDPGSYSLQVDWVGYDYSATSTQYITPDPVSFTAPNTSLTVTLQTANNTITAQTLGVSSTSSGGEEEGGETDSREGGEGGSKEGGKSDGSGGEEGGMKTRATTGVQTYYYGWTNEGKNYFFGQTDASGNMAQKVGAGKYNIRFDSMEWPKENYFSKTYSAKFADNSGSTVALGELIAQQADATIDISVFNSEGCGGGLLSSGAGASVFSESVWSWAEITSGAASVKVPAGTYSVDVYAYYTDCDQGAGQSQRVTVKSEQTATATITMQDRNATLSGKVMDEDGTGLGCQYVWGWRSDYGDWFDDQTDQDGTWSKKVTPGSWNIMSYPSGITSTNCSSSDTGSGGATSGGMGIARTVSGTPMAGASSDGNGTGITYVTLEGTQLKKATDNATTADINFTYAVADNTISGFVRYGEGHTSEGEVAGGVNGFLTVSTTSGGRTADRYANSLWGWISNSQFEIKVPDSPSGGYQLQAFMDWGSSYTVVSTGLDSAFTAASIEVTEGNEVPNAAIYVLPNDATIAGSISGFAGTAGFFAEVCADNGAGGYACTFAETGEYELKVASGSWTVNYNIPEGYGVYPLPTSDNTVTIVSQGTATVDFTLVEADSEISGTVTTPDGEALAGAKVTIGSDEIFTSTITDSDGAYSAQVPAGDYVVVASVPSDVDYLNPALEDITTAADSTTETDFTAREADATISGTMTLDGTTAEGFVVAYSDDGAMSYTEVEEDGSYSLPVIQGEEWTIVGRYDHDEGVAYDTGWETVEVTSATVDNDITFATTGVTSQNTMSIQAIRRSAAATANLPASQRKSFSSTTQSAINFSDGAVFNMPAYSLKNTEDTLSVIVTPKSEIPSSTTHQVISYGYEVEALDSNNATIGTLASSASVTLPYSETQLTNLGLSEGDLTMAVYDGTSWKDVTGTVINESANTISANVTQFGTFAVTTSTRSITTEIITESEVATPETVRIKEGSRTAQAFIVKWQAVSDADSYKVQVLNAKGTEKIKTYTVTGKTQKKIVKLTPNTKYTVRVRAVRGARQSNWSKTKAVRTLPAAPNRFTVGNKAVNADGTITFKLRFNQKANRKNLRALINVVDQNDTKVNFAYGKKAYKTKQTVALKSKKKVQKITLTVATGYSGVPLRLKVKIQNTSNPKENSTKFGKSNLFTVL